MKSESHHITTSTGAERNFHMVNLKIGVTPLKFTI